MPQQSIRSPESRASPDKQPVCRHETAQSCAVKPLSTPALPRLAPPTPTVTDWVADLGGHTMPLLLVSPVNTPAEGPCVGPSAKYKSPISGKG